MDVHELAAYLGIPISTVYDWRVHGKGPTPPAGLFHDPASSPEMTPTSSSNATGDTTRRDDETRVTQRLSAGALPATALQK